jgi:hypothetical protein
MLTEQDKRILTLLAAFNAEAQPEQRRRILHTLRPQLPGNGEHRRREGKRVPQPSLGRLPDNAAHRVQRRVRRSPWLTPYKLAWMLGSFGVTSARHPVQSRR